MAIEGRFANRPDLGALASAKTAAAPLMPASDVRLPVLHQALLQRSDAADATGAPERCAGPKVM